VLGAVLSGLAGVDDDWHPPCHALYLRKIHWEFIAVCFYGLDGRRNTKSQHSYAVPDSYRGSIWMTDFICQADRQYRSACKDLPRYPGTQYCVLHYPGEEKREVFLKVKESKLDQKDYDFSGTIFPEGTSDFHRTDFEENAIFRGATFLGVAEFGEAKFGGKETDFLEAKFSGEYTNFLNAIFSSEVTEFSRAEFSSTGWTIFRNAKFGGKSTWFNNTRFNTSINFIQVEFLSAEETNFSYAGFTKDTDFNRAKFGGERTDFGSAEFSSGSDNRIDFSNVKFSSGAWTTFVGAKFSGWQTDFSEAEFSGRSATFIQAEFSGEWADFSRAQFISELTDFSEAKFGGAALFSQTHFDTEINFRWAKFESNTYFNDTTFKYATFENANFYSTADFTRSIFHSTPHKGTDFRRATFKGEVYFKEVEFGGEGEFEGYTDFYRANFLDAVKFIGGEKDKHPSPVFALKGQVSFTRARIEKPEQFSFDTVQLRPSWLVGVDARKFDFTAVRWYGLLNGSASSFDEEIKRVADKEKGRSAHKLLAQACQRLAANAEENRDYPTANEFHYWSMEAQRKEIPGSGFAPWKLIWWYWALSGYGERQIRAAGWLIAILVGFAALYMWLGLVGVQETSLIGVSGAAWESIVYSLGVMTRLANDIPESASVLAKSLVIIEGVLGPLQIGLFLLALRRKFMR
jgi:uncharacterized protein YjbI with pentapeptide repeats